MTKEKLSEIAGVAIPILVVGLYILGFYHSSKKHEGEGHNMFLMIYRGAEFFWHNDFAGVNWDDKLQEDTKVMFVLIGKEGESETDEFKQQEVLQELKDEIKDYPKDKIEILKHRARLYIDYTNSVNKDFMKQLSNDTLYYTAHFMSSASIALTDSVSRYSDGNQLTIMADTLRKIFGDKDTAIKMKNSWSSGDMIISFKSQSDKMNGMYNNIFKGL